MPTYRNDSNAIRVVLNTEYIRTRVEPGDTVETFEFLSLPNWTQTSVDPANSVTCDAADIWTAWVKPYDDKLKYSIIGTTWSGTVTLKVKYPDGTIGIDSTYTANDQGVIEDPAQDVEYMIGIASDGYTSGSVDVGLYR